MPPLIDALTGAPGSAFPPNGSEVVCRSQDRGTLAPMCVPLWAAYEMPLSSSQLLPIETIPHIFAAVNLSAKGSLSDASGGRFADFVKKEQQKGVIFLKNKVFLVYHNAKNSYLTVK